jgi:exodeoxyribonuclease-5
MIDFSPDQLRAINGLTQFIEAPYVERNYQTLQGLAGCGKSTLLSELTRRYPNIKLCAYTGKACSILRRRVKVPVITLHSAIYDFRGLVEDEFEENRMNPIFSPKNISYHGRIIAIDEASMLGEKEATDLLNTGARVIAAGDPGQLPPIKGRQFFEQPDFTLTQIHRQALESPIIRQAHAIRNEGTYSPDGAGFRVIDFATSDELLNHETILCWRNRTRIKLNAKKRELLGLPPGELQPGEPVICLRNDHALGVFNGATYTVVGWQYPELYLRDDEARDIVIPMATIECFDPKFAERQYDDEWLAFAPGHALTIHKAQGSEYDSVLIFDECDTEIRRQLLTRVLRGR